MFTYAGPDSSRLDIMHWQRAHAKCFVLILPGFMAVRHCCRLENQVMLQEKQNEAVRQQQALQEQQQEEDEEDEDGNEADAGMCLYPHEGRLSHSTLRTIRPDLQADVVCCGPQACKAWVSSDGRVGMYIAGPAAGHPQGQPTEEDMAASQENEETLVSIMRARFLSGEDSAVNYKEIDNDASLDDDWAAQAENDAQDRYFDDD